MSNLFDWAGTHARSGDPVTSYEAAAQALPTAKRHVAMIVQYLKKIYPADATADEIAKVTNLQRHQVLKRLPDVEAAGLAKPNGRTRMMSSKRQGRCWEWVRQ